MSLPPSPPTVWIPELALLLVLPLLLAHALLTHGRAFAGIWLLLTFAFGLASEGLLQETLGWRQYAAGSLQAGSLPLYVGAAWTAGIYLGAVLAKGFVERSTLRGRILPFVLAHGLFTAVVMLPLEALAAPAGWWHDAGGLPAALLGWASGGALFGLSYRLVSRRTEHDPTKLLVLVAALPLLVAAQMGATLGLHRLLHDT